MGGVLRQRLLFERIDIDSPADALASNTLAVLAAKGERRQRDKNAVAVAAETLRLDDRPGMRRGRDVGVGHFFVTQRLRHQHRRVGAERGIDIPAREIAARRESSVRRHRRADQKDHADRCAGGFQEVTIFGQTVRRVAPRQLIERVAPELVAAARKAAGQESGDGVNVAFLDLSAADVGQG